MAIGHAEEKNGFVTVYDDRGMRMASVGGELLGYTSNNFTVKRGCSTIIYDSRGNVVSQRA